MKILFWIIIITSILYVVYNFKNNTNLNYQVIKIEKAQKPMQKIQEEPKKALINYNELNNKHQSILMLAIEKQLEESKILEIISQSTNINNLDYEGNNALYYAIKYHSSKSIILELIKKAIDINNQNNLGYTALHTAIKVEYQDEIIKILIQNGANPNLKNKYQSNAIADSLIDKKFNYTDLILTDNIIDFNFLDTNNNSLLMLSIINNAPSNIVDFFYNYSTNLEHRNNEELNYLMVLAKYSNSEDNVRLLIFKSKEFYESRDNLGNTLIHLAAKYNTNEKILHAILKATEVSINHKNNNGYTPLMLAAENNSSPKIINYLINQGALLEFQNLLGENALLIAAGNNSNSSILIELLKYPFPPRLTNKNGYNILTLAAINNKLDNLKYILDQNIIDINYQNLSGETALILSIKKQANQEILNALINIQNINFKLKDKNFKTAYNYIESINKYPKNHIYWKIQDLSQ